MYKLTSKYIYADYAGYSKLNKFVHFSTNFIIPNSNRSSSSSGDKLISDLKTKLNKIFNSYNYEIIFGHNNTDISNKLALSCTIDWKICIASELEHHSSYVPWLQQSIKNDKIFSFIDIEKPDKLIEKNVDIFLINYISNISGRNNVKEINYFKQKFPNAITIVDGAQCFGNIPDLDNSSFDIFYFSSQKCTLFEGLSICFIKKKYIEFFPPIFLGGGNISHTSNKSIFFQNNYEAGTFPLRVMYSIIKNLSVFKYKDKLSFEDLMIDLEKVTSWKLIHKNCFRTKSIYSFDTYPIHPHDISNFLLDKHIIVRSGTLCCSKFFENNRPVLRLSFGPKNNKKQIMKICIYIKKYIKLNSHLFKND